MTVGYTRISKLSICIPQYIPMELPKSTVWPERTEGICYEGMQHAWSNRFQSNAALQSEVITSSRSFALKASGVRPAKGEFLARRLRIVSTHEYFVVPTFARMHAPKPRMPASTISRCTMSPGMLLLIAFSQSSKGVTPRAWPGIKYHETIMHHLTKRNQKNNGQAFVVICDVDQWQKTLKIVDGHAMSCLGRIWQIYAIE